MIVTGVRFHNQDKNYDFNAGGLDLKLGDIVIVETEIGTESGKVATIEKREETGENSGSLKPVIRVATSVDLEKIKKYEKISFNKFDFNDVQLEHDGYKGKICGG